jgi:DNA polymerase elongation subunit (family B)
VAAILSRSYFTQAQIFPYNYQDVIVRGNATKINALFLREYLRRRHSIPELPNARPFEGGYTDIFATGVIENVWHCDVTSLYPSLMLAFGYLPKDDALGVVGGMLRDLRAFRLEAKSALRLVEDPLERGTLHALQGTFKILLNSFYGYLGFAQGNFADFDAAEKVTAKGREILRQMVSWLAARGAKVIEIDTDGIYFRPPERVAIEELRTGLAGELPDGIEVELDKRYPAMFSYKAKNYALLEESGALILKGAALKSRGMEPYLREYLETFLRLLLQNEPEKAAALREELALKIRKREISIEALAKTEALQDSVASYLKKITASSRNRSAAFELAIKSGRNYQAGDQITYYVTGANKKVVAYENARFVSEWTPEARDENIDYYVAKLDDLAKKFQPHATKEPVQRDLFSS